MSFDLSTAPDEVVAAYVERLQAEASVAKAEAAKARLDARVRKLDVAKREREEARILTSNEHHNTYFFGASVGPKSVEACVNRTNQWSRTDPKCDIEVVFSSPGGSIIDGFVLFDHLRSLSAAGHKVTTGSLGMAASMAGILLQAGDERWMGKEAWVLIHRASFSSAGETFKVEDRVEWIKRVESRIIDIFVARTDGELTSQKIRRNWERKDWWLNSDECIEYNIVDDVKG